MSLSGLLQFVRRSLLRLELSLSQAAGFDRFGECAYCNERVLCDNLHSYNSTFT